MFDAVQWSFMETGRPLNFTTSTCLSDVTRSKACLIWCGPSERRYDNERWENITEMPQKIGRRTPL